jgi:putative membrane-bound dehydrogenase-like protein
MLLVLLHALLLSPATQSPASASPDQQDPPPVVTRAWPFGRQQLSERFLCEGAAFGDLDGDGDADVVAGPWWYEGPDFTVRHALGEEKRFHPLHYSEQFFHWIHDLDGDGRNDVFVVGFPGATAWWWRNTGDKDRWERFEVCSGVDNESPAFVDLDGDGRPDLVCQNQDRLGWFSAGADPREPWTFRAALPSGAGGRYTHGLGVGDLDGDGRPDLVRREGFYRQPASLDGDPAWTFVPANFGDGHGGAQMLVTDVDGDGDADVVTAISAHGWGLAWFEQRPDGSFLRHAVLPTARAEGNVSELHALCLADLDGDGLLDVVTGKRWWSHGPSKNGNADGANDDAVLLGLLLRREETGARYEVVVLDDQSGVGTQVAAGDVDGDGLVDVVVANKRGAFVLRQPPRPDLGFESGTLRGWIATGNAFDGQPVSGDRVAARRPEWRSGQDGDWWIGGYELLGDAATGTLTSLPFVAEKPWATFLIGGGRHHGTRVEVLTADDRVLCSASGRDREQMEPVLVDLRSVLGQSIRVRIVDEVTGGWGHVNFDAFMFHDRPVRGDLPRAHTGLSPTDAARAMRVPEGFAVDLVAAEPAVRQPVALWVDERARLWVAEAYSYPTRRPDAEARDAIVVFEDEDGDGTYEKRTVFHDRLNLVSGLAVGFGGVWIGAAPYLLFVPDKDGDLVPDGPSEVVLDGFGYEDTHETLNSFTFGPDGWLYGTHGVYTHSKVGTPGTPDAQRVPLNCGVFRFHPVRRTFEVFAWGTSNPWGIDFDDRGEAFLACCVIPHLWHVVPGARLQRQSGSHFDAHPWRIVETIADHLHYIGDLHGHAWWHGRNRAVLDPGVDAAGGGHAHCGTLVYKGTAFPAEYRNAILCFNVHGNRVNQDRLERRGSGYVGRHAHDLVLAHDPWFRGVALRQGAHGEVFFIDWYDQSACHRNDDQLWDRSNGRLYRLRHGALRAGRPGIATASDEQLAALQRSDDDFHVGHARRILHERAQQRGIAGAAVAALRAQLDGDGEARVRLRALWALFVIEALDEPHLLRLCGDACPDVRAWAVRLAAERPERLPAVIASLPALVRTEADPAVRLACASALQRLPAADVAFELAAALLAHAEDAEDHNLPAVLWYGVERLHDEDVARFLAVARAAQLAPVRELMWQRAAIDPAGVAALVPLLAEPSAPRHEMLAAMLEGLRRSPGAATPSGWAEVAPLLLADADAAVRDQAADLALAFGDRTFAPAFRDRLVDRGAPLDRRRAALEGLVRLRDAATGPLLLQILDEPELRRPALEALGAYDLPEAPRRLIQLLRTFDAVERDLAVQVLAQRVGSARALLRAVLDGQADARLLDAAALRRQLALLEDKDVDALLQSAWGRSLPPSASTAAEIARYKQMLTPEALAAADRSNGRAVFTNTCMACHRLWDEGGVLAPDLTGGNRKDLDFLLSNILDPSAEMSRDYQMVTVRLQDGRQLHGKMVRETRTHVTIATTAGESTFARRELAADGARPAVEYTAVSLMPTNQLQLLRDGDARDLIAYLMGNEQAPMPANEWTVRSFFDGRSLQGWHADPAVWSVEGGEIVGRTKTGLRHNSFAVGPLEFGDVRLQFEVLLTPDTANSGVQFRSVEVGGEVHGYQADIGAGWWGMLYEEHGRGVLSRPAAAAARPGEWNRYEILAVGDRVQLAINGVPTVDLVDPPGRRRGVFALQVHGGGPTEVRFRGFEIELDPEPVLRTVR